MCFRWSSLGGPWHIMQINPLRTQAVQSSETKQMIKSAPAATSSCIQWHSPSSLSITGMSLQTGKRRASEHYVAKNGDYFTH